MSSESQNITNDASQRSSSSTGTTYQQSFSSIESTYQQSSSSTGPTYQELVTMPTGMSSFLHQIDPENCEFFLGLFHYFKFEVSDVMLMKCCQLTPLVDINHMVKAVRFWDKLEHFKKMNPSYMTVNYKQTINPASPNNLIDILTWAVSSNIKGASVLKGLFASLTLKGLTKPGQTEITNIVIKYLKEHNIEITDDILENMAGQLEQYYRGESKDTYFKVEERNGRTYKSGKLWNKKYNAKRDKTVATNKATDEKADTIMSIFSSFDSGD